MESFYIPLMHEVACKYDQHKISIIEKIYSIKVHACKLCRHDVKIINYRVIRMILQNWSLIRI